MKFHTIKDKFKREEAREERRRGMNDEIHSILAEAEGLRHLKDDECFRLGETVAKALSALNDDETERLTDLITNANQ